MNTSACDQGLPQAITNESELLEKLSGGDFGVQFVDDLTRLNTDDLSECGFNRNQRNRIRDYLVSEGIVDPAFVFPPSQAQALVPPSASFLSSSEEDLAAGPRCPSIWGRVPTDVAKFPLMAPILNEYPDMWPPHKPIGDMLSATMYTQYIYQHQAIKHQTWPPEKFSYNQGFGQLWPLQTLAEGVDWNDCYRNFERNLSQGIYVKRFPFTSHESNVVTVQDAHKESKAYPKLQKVLHVVPEQVLYYALPSMLHHKVPFLYGKYGIKWMLPEPEATQVAGPMASLLMEHAPVDNRSQGDVQAEVAGWVADEAAIGVESRARDKAAREAREAPGMWEFTKLTELDFEVSTKTFQALCRGLKIIPLEAARRVLLDPDDHVTIKNKDGVEYCFRVAAPAPSNGLQAQAQAPDADQNSAHLDSPGAWRVDEMYHSDPSDVEDEFVIEKLIGKRKVSGVLQYQVKWVGFNDLTWKTDAELRIDNCFEAIKDYDKAEKARQKEVRAAKARAAKEKAAKEKADQPPLSEYEVNRLQRLQNNTNKISELGIQQAAAEVRQSTDGVMHPSPPKQSDVNESAGPPKQCRKHKRGALEPPRQSPRKQSKVAETQRSIGDRVLGIYKYHSGNRVKDSGVIVDTLPTGALRIQFDDGDIGNVQPKHVYDANSAILDTTPPK